MSRKLPVRAYTIRTMPTPTDTTPQTAAEVRALCRRGQWTGPTAGLAPGFAQANLVVVRETAARSFEAFCRANPAPCPLIEVAAPGQFEPLRSAPGADLRTDLPRYRTYRQGRCVDRPTDILDVWNAADLDGQGRPVAFLIGCSFTFEAALLAAGIPIRHIEQRCNVPMYRTDVNCRPVEPFRGSLVVSMRPMNREQADRAAEITARLPHAHGAPIHIGDPAAIGIADLSRPDYGDSVDVRPGEIPVFWACGVTPTEALLNARLDLAITHEPGHMFLTDLPDH